MQGSTPNSMAIHTKILTDILGIAANTPISEILSTIKELQHFKNMHQACSTQNAMQRLHQEINELKLVMNQKINQILEIRMKGFGEDCEKVVKGLGKKLDNSHIYHTKDEKILVEANKGILYQTIPDKEQRKMMKNKGEFEEKNKNKISLKSFKAGESQKNQNNNHIRIAQRDSLNL